MLGTESGVSITDFDGSIEVRAKEYLSTHPGAEFWEIHKNLLNPYEGNLVENTISPRAFECAAHHTAMILFPGDYSGILQPWVHYIPLQKDFSNMQEVVDKLNDPAFLHTMTEQTYRDIIASGKFSYQAMIQEFDAVIEDYHGSVLEKDKTRPRFWYLWLKNRIQMAIAPVQRFFLRDVLSLFYVLHILKSFFVRHGKVLASKIIPAELYAALRENRKNKGEESK